MKVLICDPVDKGAIEKMQKAGLTVDDKAGITPDELLKVVGDYNALVVRSATKVTKDVFSKAKNLKIVVRGGVGMDNIDKDAAKSAGVKADNTPEASSIGVAELAIGMMFTFARNISVADATTKAGKWEKKKLKGFELYKKTLGLIGMGRIGFETALRAIALGMSVIAYDPYVKADDERFTRVGIKIISLDEILKNSDFISMHLPLTNETKYMINKDSFAKMKPNAVIVNCARGGVVNEADLASAIKEGKIAGACVDVFETEPVPKDNPLLGLGNKVILTPHLGASSKEGQGRVGEAVADKLIAFSKSL